MNLAPVSNEDNAESVPLIRAEGITSAERYLKQLCDHTFLSLWSYPGLFRDQGVAEQGIGKEICDLLVVFENHVIIFSDKDCQFPSTGDIKTDWNRWFKKAVYKSAKQAWGAVRWIKSNPNRIFIDQKCSQPFPLKLPDPEEASYHIAVLNHLRAKLYCINLGNWWYFFCRIPFTNRALICSKQVVHKAWVRTKVLPFNQRSSTGFSCGV